MTAEPDPAHVVHEAIREILPATSPARITDRARLADLGADSIDRLEIILAITRAIGADVSLTDFARLPDVGALIEHLTQLRGVHGQRSDRH